MKTMHILYILLLLGVFVFFWNCYKSIEAFEDIKMRPWFGYEPGLYGPGWGRKGCSSDLSCTKA